MGNGVTKASQYCFANGTAGEISRRHDDIAVKGLGHSFCYVKADQARISNSKIHHQSEEITTFYSISGASVSANTSSSSNLSSDVSVPYSSGLDEASAFESSDSFASVPLQPVPRGSGQLQTISGPAERGFLSGPMERGFLSGPIERGFLSAPIDRDMYSGLVEKEKEKEKSSCKLEKSLSSVGFDVDRVTEVKKNKRNVIKTLKRAISDTISRGKRSLTGNKNGENSIRESCNLSFNNDPDEEESIFSTEHDRNLHWAQGKAGEDRVHIVISEENKWVFVGIYDGFNGPDAPDFLLSNLYTNVNEELKGLLWSDQTTSNEINHYDILKALSKALKKTEDEFFEIADKMAEEKPELALMGSCVLVMVMKGEDVYLMNVGDSRVVLAQKCDTDLRLRKGNQDLEMISEDNLHDLEFISLNSIQLTMDHSTYVHKEVQRIKKEHPDDPSAVTNDRVKGYLKVTRAFGVGFLKQAKWNDLLLEMFRIDYVGASPYVTCFPSLYHHRLNSRDRFLILSSDGLYQYFTNEEAVSQVELFIAAFPEGDPAQHLIEEVLFRAAKRAGIDFHELLDIPQGDRRRYHDDVSVIIISLEGRIWRSYV
ncbi:probable protein phosphatase 2C 4 [Mercurialis annua]|uniref:probable protein phosphatase 2C 4 n=1 Tax=Mercurialis annua TaxID=3986 RepID=UPI00215F0479|nr:probable protein phosphatase 2C 4 [Mercurialis annua]